MIKLAWISKLFRGIWMYPAGGFNREASAHSKSATEEIRAEGKTLKLHDCDPSSCRPEPAERVVALGMLA